MNLKTIRTKARKTHFSKTIDYYLKGCDYKFKIPMSDIKGYRPSVYRDDDTGDFYLYERNGESVLISVFTIGYQRRPLWKTLQSLAYSVVRDPKTGLLYSGRRTIERGFSDGSN